MINEWHNTLGDLFYRFVERTTCKLMFFALQDEDIEEDFWLSL